MKLLSQTGLAELISKIKAWGAATFLDKTDVEQTTTIGVDSAPTSGSTNLVTSGGVKTALDGKEAKGKITISGVEKTANVHTVTIVTNGVTTTLTVVGVS